MSQGGDFVNHNEDAKWTKLDNASRVFPSTYSEKDTKVFRFTCELNEAVDPVVLQEALDLTAENFPLYKSVMRRGIFWYYLESSKIKPYVGPESLPVCAPLYLGHKRNLLFRVFYYRRRINLEVFHALSDGTGAFLFMQALVHRYLLLKHGDKYTGDPPILKEASVSEKMVDSFDKHYSGGNPFAKKARSREAKPKKSAYRIPGTRLPENRTALIEGAMSAKAVLNEAHKYNTTLTVFLTSLLAYSIYKEMPVRKRKHPVVLSIPINLRQFFNSETARNFFSTMTVSYDFSQGTHDFENVITVMRKYFQTGLTENQLTEKLERYVRLAKNPFIRIMPLQLKNILLRIGAWHVDRQTTSFLSNIGRVSMPPVFDGIIRQFSACVGGKYPKIILCTYGDRLVISFSSPFKDTDVQRTFFRLLTEMGIDVEITSNL